MKIPNETTPLLGKSLLTTKQENQADSHVPLSEKTGNFLGYTLGVNIYGDGSTQKKSPSQQLISSLLPHLYEEAVLRTAPAHNEYELSSSKDTVSLEEPYSEEREHLISSQSSPSNYGTFPSSHVEGDFPRTKK